MRHWSATRQRFSVVVALRARASLWMRIFRQGWSTKSTPEDGGRGFGLALTRLVCRRRGGDVTVQNADGAVFTATLPTAVRGELEEVQA